MWGEYSCGARKDEHNGHSPKEMEMKNRKWLVRPLALVLCNGLMSEAQAQRVPDKEARKQQNRERLQNMSPEEREAFRNQRRARRQNGQGGQDGQNAEKRGRKLMSDAGFVDASIQDAIVAFMEEQKQARRPLMEMAQRIAAQLRDETVSPTQISASLAQLRKASSDDKARYEKALDALDAKINFSTNPRLEAFLTLIGVMGDEASALGNRNAIFGVERGGEQLGAANGATANGAQD